MRTRVKSSKDVSKTSYVIISRMTLLWALLSLKIAIIAVDVHTETVLVSVADYIYYVLTILVIILNILFIFYGMNSGWYYFVDSLGTELEVIKLCSNF